MKYIGSVMILFGLLVIGVGLLADDGRLIIVGAVGLALGAIVEGYYRAVPAVVLVIVSATVEAGPPLTDSGAGKPVPAPKFFVRTPTSPEEGIQAARIFLEKSVNEYDRPFLRFFWFGDLPEEYRRFLTLWRVYLQTINNQSPLVHSLPVPGTNDALWFYDLRLAGQTTEAFAAVARRDAKYREPFIAHVEAEGLRRLLGIKADVRNFHVEGMVPGCWFLRQIMQPEGQSPAYYDLLYAQERYGPEAFVTVGKLIGAVGTGFGSGKAIVAGLELPPEPVKPVGRPWVDDRPWPTDGRRYPSGSFEWVPQAEIDAYEKARAAWTDLKTRLATEAKSGKAPLPPGQVFLEGKLVKDFPANLKEFQERWGSTAIEDFLGKQNLKVDNGEVVAGILDDPRNGSIVSYRNRIIKFSGNPFNNGGVNMSTKDFLKSSGGKNLANFPKEVAYDKFDEDASEHLFTMPNGLPAALLAGGAKDGRKRVDFGDARLVRSSLDPHHGVIFTQYSCVICHGPSDGVLAPTNRKLGGVIDSGRGPLVKEDPFTANVISQFATDWDWKMAGWRRPYARAISRMTATKAEPKGWDGARYAKETVDFVGWYDFPVSLPQAAAELGLPQLGVMLVCLQEGSYDAQELFMGNGVPRQTWDEDLYPRLALIYTGMRNATDPDPLFAWFYPELVRQTQEKVKSPPLRSK